MLSSKLKNISLSSLYKEALTLKAEDPKDIALGMAGALLFELYGRAWMSEKIMPKIILTFRNKGKDGFLDEFKFQSQLLILAESLYNFKNIEGVENILENLKNVPLESIIAELESARILFHRRINFKFVTKSYKKRADFDIHIINNQNYIFCETKCKIDKTGFSVNSFNNSLHKAKKQLPIDNPALIMIKIPYTWEQYEQKLKKNSFTFVNKSDRPLGIVCWYEKWFPTSSVFKLRAVSGFEVHNDKSKIFNSRLIPFLPGQSQTPHWKHFEDFASGYL